MIPLSNLHTHTVFCDGNDTPEEIVLSAIEKKMETLGFSGHAYLFDGEDWCMSPGNEEKYYNEIRRLQKVYGDRLHILLGLEQDIDSPAPNRPYDYIIGSVHCLEADGEHFAIDLSPESFEERVKKHYFGDFIRICRAYYERVAQLADVTSCDVIGHFDLITKYNDGGRLFDEQDPRYLTPALEALDYLLEKDVVFEINTGAISRGYRRTPYPSPLLLRRIAEKQGRVTLSSDAHSKENLLYGFSEAKHIVRSSGIGCLWMMTRKGWECMPI